MSNQTPVITIQCDWNDVVRLPKGEAWISAKQLNQNSVHDKLTTTLSDGKIKIIFSEDYQYISLSPLCLTIKHVPSGLRVAFVAPSKVHKIHNRAMLSVSVAENALAVSSCEEDKLLVWDSRTSEVILNLKGHGGPVYKCRYFPSGVVVISAGADGSCRIWSAESGINPVTLIGHTMAVCDICIVDRGRNVISVSKDGCAKLWDVGESKCLNDLLDGSGPINCCALALTNDHFEVENEREVGTENKLLLAGSEQGTVYCIHVARKRPVFLTNVDSACNALTVVEESVIVGCSNGKVLQINIQNGAIVKEWYESASPVLSLVSLPNQTFIVGRQDGTCTVLSLQDTFSRLRVQLTGPDCDGIRDLSFNGKWVFAACRDANVRKYDFNQINVHFK